MAIFNMRFEFPNFLFWILQIQLLQGKKISFLLEFILLQFIISFFLESVILNKFQYQLRYLYIIPSRFTILWFVFGFIYLFCWFEFIYTSLLCLSQWPIIFIIILLQGYKNLVLPRKNNPEGKIGKIIQSSTQT